MAIHFSDLIYTDNDAEQDSIHYLESGIYCPSYITKVKDFLKDDLDDFTHFYNNNEYRFINIYYDDFCKGYTELENKIVPNTDFLNITNYITKAFKNLDVTEDDIEYYVSFLDSEFKKNALCTHMEPFFINEDAVVSTVIAGFSRNPLHSIYSIVREWCMAMHLKYMYPKQFKRMGFQYQTIQTTFTNEERLVKSIDFKEKYRHLLNQVSILRAIHSSVFAYAYIYLKSVETKEISTAEEFILDESASKITLLLKGESIKNFDFPVTQKVLENFKNGKYEDFILSDGTIDWESLYYYIFDIMKKSNYEGVHIMGFDSIEAKVLRSFWNKSPNMQSMLKILRKLSLESNNPLYRKLIDGCEYKLGRTDKTKLKMENFIEETRKIMAARSYELTKPRTVSQEYVSAFPSVFLVYFQWHHSFRTIYPKVPKAKITEQQNQAKNLHDILSEQIKKYNDDIENKNKNIIKEESLAKTLSTQFEQKKYDENILKYSYIENINQTNSKINEYKSQTINTENTTNNTNAINNSILERNLKENSY